MNVTNIYLSVSEPHNKSDFSLSVSHILIIFKSWCKVDNVDVHVCVCLHLCLPVLKRFQEGKRFSNSLVWRLRFWRGELIGFCAVQARWIYHLRE